MGYFSTAGVEFIRNEMDWDTYDAWGSVMAAAFDLCEAWWLSTGECLSGYTPPKVEPYVCESERVDRLSNAMDIGMVDKGDVDYWFNVLQRMRDLVIMAGRDY
jgi:hypothetical protein